MIVQFAGAMSVPDDLAAYLLVSGGPMQWHLHSDLRLRFG